MRRYIIGLLVGLLLSTLLNATTVYEDAEDGNVDQWRILNDSSVNPFQNVYSNSNGSRVIYLNGGSRILGGYTGTSSAWNNRSEKTISWRLRVCDRYTIFVLLNTTKGLRYLFYNDLPRRYLFHNESMQDAEGHPTAILTGLGGRNSNDWKGVWKTYTQDLEQDLKNAEPDNDIVSVDGFIYSGSEAYIDDILLYNPEETVYENGEQGLDRWHIIEDAGKGAAMSITEDNQTLNTQAHVLFFEGDKESIYRLNDINNSVDQIIQWKSKFYHGYEVTIDVNTTLGQRSLFYVNRGQRDISGGLIEEENRTVIFHELGHGPLAGVNYDTRLNGEINNFWQTVTRDLQQDIRNYEPENRLLSVNSFQIHGTGLLDDIKMLSRPIIAQPMPEGTYEDAEDGSSSRWHVYDNDPAGATFNNVHDENRKSRVIEFSGSGMENGYEIGSRRGDGQWNNRDHNAISWSMNFSEPFSIYVAIETTNGVRYMTYRSTGIDAGLQGSYIYFGLGDGVNNGTWQTFTRNLESDLHRFEPNNDLVAIHAFLIRGSGRIDDIQTLHQEDDADNDGGVLEDAEDGNTDGWSIYVNTSGEASITNIESVEKQSRVIGLQGMGKSDGYQYTIDKSNLTQLSWEMNFGESYTVFISLDTANGRRYLTYTPRDFDKGVSGEYLGYGLGSDTVDGTWRTITRDVVQDLINMEPDNSLIKINTIMIRGSGLIDNIVLQ